MSEDHAKPNPEEAAGKPALTWRDVWQVPLLVLSVGVVCSAAYRALTLVPKPDLHRPITDAEKLLEDGKPREAIELLNKDLFPYVGTDKLDDELQGEFHRLMGRSLFLGQRELGIDREDNNKNIADSYLEAEALLKRLPAVDESYLAETYVALGELDKARRRADKLPQADRERKLELYKSLVNGSMKPGASRDEQAFDLVTAMLGDPELTSEERAWALSRQAELQLERGFAEDAINRLLRELPRLEDVPASERGTLHMQLARAYLETGSIEPALRQLEMADTLVPEDDSRRALLGVMQGRAAMMRGDQPMAREHFEGVLGKAPPPRWQLAAEMGLAQSAAAMDDDEESQAAWERVVHALTSGEGTREVTATRSAELLTARADDRFARGKMEEALKYAMLALRCTGEAKVAPATIERLAMCHRALADELIAAVKKSSTSDIALADLDPATRVEVKSHLLSAADYFRKHADRVVLSDVNAYSQSLWMAGDCYDRGGDQEAALRIFQLYASDRPGDPRQPEARFRLAQALQARGDLENAASIYQDLVRSRDAADQASGPWADASEVPLARVMLLDANDENDAEAEQILRSVAGGAIGGPDTPAFRDAVFELANHYYRKGDYDRAIERFDEAAKRYPSDPRALGSTFKLGDSLRLGAADIDRALTQALPPAEKLRLESTKRERLGRAMTLFEEVRRKTEASDERRRSASAEAFMKNAYFYLGECAFRLRDYDTAIARYNAAKDRFPQDPASLVAMTQIVSCHLRQGDVKRAKAANERAKRFYASLPGSVWDDPTLPMTRADWERWLEATAELWNQSDGTRVANTEEAEPDSGSDSRTDRDP